MSVSQHFGVARTGPAYAGPHEWDVNTTSHHGRPGRPPTIDHRRLPDFRRVYFSKTVLKNDIGDLHCGSEGVDAEPRRASPPPQAPPPKNRRAPSTASIPLPRGLVSGLSDESEVHAMSDRPVRARRPSKVTKKAAAKKSTTSRSTPGKRTAKATAAKTTRRRRRPTARRPGARGQRRHRRGVRPGSGQPRRRLKNISEVRHFFRTNDVPICSSARPRSTCSAWTAGSATSPTSPTTTPGTARIRGCSRRPTSRTSSSRAARRSTTGC